jgi:Heterokaryon incompatibility protein (HET)
MNIQPYQYLPLENGRTIRLIALSPAKTADQPLECIILHAPLDDPLPYAALSYEWKGEKPQRPMTCEDGSTILITPNCYAALIRLRHRKKFQILWVDAICINQADVQERNSQVSIMIDIYKSSDRTFVWLGEGDSDSDLALQFSRRASFVYRHKRLRRLLPKDNILSWNMLGTGKYCISCLRSNPYLQV